MRITSKGQVTIPLWVREKYGFMPETDIEFVERDGGVALKAAGSEKPDRGQQLVSQLRGRAERSISTEEIMRLSRHYDE